MKHIKTFEKLNQKKPQVGDYVICQDEEDDLISFMNNNIGKIIDISHNDKIPFDIEYENIPSNIQNYFGFNNNIKNNNRVMSREEILYWSKNKEDLKQIILQRKYNI